MKNWPLLWKVMEHIEAHPDEWDQTSWMDGSNSIDKQGCGTTCCFAGHAVLMAMPDVKPNFQEGLFYMDGESIDPEDTACQLLGLGVFEGHELFYNYSNDPADLRAILDGWAADDAAS